MHLTYQGGVSLPLRPEASKHSLQLDGVPMVLLPLGMEEEAYELTLCQGETVLPGEKVAVLGDGTPVYSTISGAVTGVFEKDGMHYVAVEKGETSLPNTPVAVRPPEEKALNELTDQELLESIKILGVRDLWSGDYLWRRLKNLIGKIRRIVIDTTDDSGWSFTGYRTALKYPGEVLSGAKILLHLLGATKVILAVDPARPKVMDAFRVLINDPALLVLAPVEVKYPMREETLYETIYVRHLAKGRSAEDEGVLFVKAQTAVALYQCILTGMPHLMRTLTVAGDGFGKNGVVTLPYGTPWRTVLETMQFKSGAYETKVNSLLCGEKAVGAMSEKAEAVFASMPVQRQQQHCISCGKCADVCPMRLQPFLALQEKSYLSAKHLASVCIGCGCCEYICPSGIRLPELIRRHQA